MMRIFRISFQKVDLCFISFQMIYRLCILKWIFILKTGIETPKHDVQFRKTAKSWNPCCCVKFKKKLCHTVNFRGLYPQFFHNATGFLIRRKSNQSSSLIYFKKTWWHWLIRSLNNVIELGFRPIFRGL